MNFGSRQPWGNRGFDRYHINTRLSKAKGLYIPYEIGPKADVQIARSERRFIKYDQSSNGVCPITTPYLISYDLTEDIPMQPFEG